MENSRTKWVDRFIISAIIQGGIITSLALVIVGFQVTFTAVNIMQLLSVSFEGPAKWFFIGIIFYLIIVIAIAVTALFYYQFEVNLKRKFSGGLKALAWIHLIGMNVGGAGAMLYMIFAGLAGSGVLSLFTEGKVGKQDSAIMDSFIEPIGVFVALLGIGVVCGGLAFITAYIKKE
jgi:hypothetical protein